MSQPAADFSIDLSLTLQSACLSGNGSEVFYPVSSIPKFFAQNAPYFFPLESWLRESSPYALNPQEFLAWFEPF